ncbi:MAG: hypothetical protein AB7J35_20510 [Dehalococcoidia bacterium]
MAAVVAAAGAWLLFAGGSSEAPPVDDRVVADIESVLAGLPHAEGETDIDQMRSLLGPPDAFTLFLESDAEGHTGRREEWYYFDYLSVYSFLDGKLETNLPLADAADFTVLPRRWDPGMFDLGVEWPDLADVIGDPARFESYEFEPEYEVPGTYYVGNQLLLLFDDEGKLYYVEAIPLEPDDGGEPS